jgi:hypothetical protein
MDRYSLKHSHKEQEIVSLRLKSKRPTEGPLLVRACLPSVAGKAISMLSNRLIRSQALYPLSYEGENNFQ